LPSIIFPDCVSLCTLPPPYLLNLSIIPIAPVRPKPRPSSSMPPKPHSRRPNFTFSVHIVIPIAHMPYPQPSLPSSAPPPSLDVVRLADAHVIPSSPALFRPSEPHRLCSHRHYHHTSHTRTSYAVIRAS
jgi:hypothetical protein